MFRANSDLRRENPRSRVRGDVGEFRGETLDGDVLGDVGEPPPNGERLWVWGPASGSPLALRVSTDRFGTAEASAFIPGSPLSSVFCLCCAPLACFIPSPGMAQVSADSDSRSDIGFSVEHVDGGESGLTLWLGESWVFPSSEPRSPSA